MSSCRLLFSFRSLRLKFLFLRIKRFWDVICHFLTRKSLRVIYSLVDRLSFYFFSSSLSSLIYFTWFVVIEVSLFLFSLIGTHPWVEIILRVSFYLLNLFALDHYFAWLISENLLKLILRIVLMRISFLYLFKMRRRY